MTEVKISLIRKAKRAYQKRESEIEQTKNYKARKAFIECFGEPPDRVAGGICYVDDIYLDIYLFEFKAVYHEGGSLVWRVLDKCPSCNRDRLLGTIKWAVDNTSYLVQLGAILANRAPMCEQCENGDNALCEQCEKVLNERKKFDERLKFLESIKKRND